MKNLLERPLESQKKTTGYGRSLPPVRKESMKALAEAMILQSMEDFWSSAYKNESMEFFKGEGFHICAEMAGMGREDQMKVLQMLADPMQNDIEEGR